MDKGGPQWLTTVLDVARKQTERGRMADCAGPFATIAWNLIGEKPERKNMEFKNESGLEFTDISSEEYREYLFSAGDGSNTSIRIPRPTKLNVSASGGHRVFSEEGRSYYIPPKWIALYWEVKEGAPNFVK